MISLSGSKSPFRSSAFLIRRNAKVRDWFFKQQKTLVYHELLKKDKNVRLNDTFRNFALPAGVGDFYAVIGLKVLKKRQENSGSILDYTSERMLKLSILAVSRKSESLFCKR